MQYEELYKRWAAEVYKLKLDDISSVDFGVSSGSCSYGTCNYESFDVIIYMKKAPKKGHYRGKTYIRDDCGDATLTINSILEFQARET